MSERRDGMEGMHGLLVLEELIKSLAVLVSFQP
jgi:hypothetical protein